MNDKKAEPFRFFTIADLREKAKAEPSIFNGALRDFCEMFDRAWQAFRYKDDALVQYSFQPGTLRYVTVHVRIGALTLAQSFEWMYLSEPGMAFHLAVTGAEIMRSNLYNKLEHIAIQMVKAQPVKAIAEYCSMSVPEEYFDKVLAGEINALPLLNGEDFEKGTILRLYREREPSAAFYDGPPEPETYQSIDVKVTGCVACRDSRIRGIVCFESLAAAA